MAYTDPTESIYRVVGEYLQPYSATIGVPYNIANIKNSGSIFYNDQKNIHSKSAENFVKAYEVVNTTGRRDINLYRNAYPLTQSISRVKLNGQTAYTMPARTRNENVIAVIFSAPGSSDDSANGQRDIEGEEYSSNNGINLRNNSLRKQLNDDAKASMTASAYTLHGTNKNTRYRISSATLAIESKYDNGFVTQMIPYHVDQIEWLSQSLMKTDTQKKSHYVYFNEQTGSEYNFTSSMSGSELSKSWGTNYFGVYGYPTWLQIRAGENWRHKAFSKKSYFYVNRRENTQEGKGTRRDEWDVITTGTFDTSSEGFLMFKEPIVDFANEQSFIRVKDPNNNTLLIKTPIYKTSFYNDELNNIYGINVLKEEKNALKNYVGEEEFSYSFGKKYQIYPSPKVSGLNRTRQRENFIFKHWRNDYFRSQSQVLGGATPNAENIRQVTDSTYAGYTAPSLYAFNYTGSIWPLDMYVHPTMYQTGGKYVAGELMLSPFSPELTQSAYSQRPWVPTVCYRSIYPPQNPSSILEILPWTAYRGANSIPFQDSEDVYSLHITKKYKNYSVVPEFNVSNKINSGNFSQLFKTLYDNSFQFENTGSYFVNNTTNSYIIKNKLQFNINTVVKVRPYENFYPVNYTLECAKQLSASLSKISIYHSIPEGYSHLKTNYINLAMYPFYSPGILYASIKAGLPMPFSVGDQLTTSAIFAFESIFDPLPVIRDKYQGYSLNYTESLSTDLYTNMISNFLNEVNDTFCKNSSRKYFESAPESEYKVFVGGTSYIMDIVLSTGKLDISASNITDRGRAIIGGVNYIGYKHNYNPSVIAPWWPGNISDDTSKGIGITRITFTPTLTRKYTLDEILAYSTVSFFRNFTDLTGNYQAYPKLTSSFNLFQKVTDSNGNNKWQINSKWEFPYLVMTGALDHYSNSFSTRKIESTWPEACIEYAGGLWHDFCDIPSDDKGIFLSINDFRYLINGTLYTSASLADMVGFPYNKRKRVGEINDNKEISELLCIVPINKEDNSFFIIDVPSKDNNKKKNSSIGSLGLEVENSEDISDTYFKNLHFANKYMLPPRVDYSIPGNKPVLMFCTEIIDTWSRRDLAFIWQNVLPQNGLSHSEKNYVYEVTEQKDLTQLKDKNIYFMIFKCKKRSISNPVGTYGYNWPWDQFSLCEMAQVELVTEDGLE